MGKVLTMELTKEDPAPSRGGPSAQGSWRVVAERVRAEPNEWFVVAERPGHAGRVLAARLNRGHVAGWPEADFEVVARSTGEGAVKVHARYVGTGT